MIVATEKTDQEEEPSYHKLRGCHKNIPGGSVEDFLARSRADKEHELEIEKRQEEERTRRAGIKKSYGFICGNPLLALGKVITMEEIKTKIDALHK